MAGGLCLRRQAGEYLPNVLSANGDEAANAVTWIQKEEKAQGKDVEGLSIDGADFNGPVLRELTDPNGLDLDVTVPPPAKQPRVILGPDRFPLTVIDENVGELLKSRAMK